MDISQTVSSPVRLAGTLILGALLGLSAWDCTEESAAPTTPAPAPPAPTPAPPPPSDPASLRLSVTGVTVREGETVSFGVSLTTQPNSEVRVAVTSSDPDAVQISTGAALVFTPANWSAEQQVTLTGKQDADAVNETAVIRLDPESGDPAYGSLPDTTLNAAVMDNDVAGLQLSVTAMTVGEGDTVSFGVSLTTQPNSEVRVAVTSSDPEAVQISTGAALIFTSANWSAEQQVTLTGKEDADAVNETAVIRLDPDSGDPAYGSLPDTTLNAAVVDDDVASLRVSATAVTVEEGDTVSFGVSLTTQPNSEVRVAVTSSDPDVVQISTGAALVFTPANWSAEQQVTLTGKQDADAVNETAVIRLDPESGDPAYRNLPDTTLSAEVKDNEVASLRVLNPLIEVREGEEARLFFLLTVRPAADVVVVATSSAPELVTVSGDRLRIAADDWSERQTVVLVARQDADARSGEAQIRLEVVEGDPAYRNVPSATALVRVHDDDGAGIHLSEAELSVREGESVPFAVRLTSQPSAGVTVAMEVNQRDRGRTRPERLVFTPANWNVDQAVEVEALHDRDGANDRFAIRFQFVSTDPSYGELEELQTVTVHVTDDEPLDLYIVTRGRPNAIVEGETVTYGVSLGVSQPTGNVTVRVRSSDPDVVRVLDGETLLFTPDTYYDDWRPVTLYAVPDPEDDTDEAEITHEATGGGFDGFPTGVNRIRVLERGSGGPALVVSTRLVSLREGGRAAFEVRLATQPTADVTLVVASSDESAVSVRGAIAGSNCSPIRRTVTTCAFLTITPDDWDENHQVLLVGEQDADAEGERASVQLVTRSDDRDYARLNVLVIGVVVTDDEAGQQ